MDEARQASGGGDMERRRASRRKVLRAAQIVTLNKMSTIDCTVRNLSAIGALITAPSLQDIPDRFIFERRARCAWFPAGWFVSP